jgi:hypothetical protein
MVELPHLQVYNDNFITQKQQNNASVFHLSEEFEDTKGEIRIRKSKKNRQHNDERKKDKQRSTKHQYKTKDRVTRKIVLSHLPRNTF